MKHSASDFYKPCGCRSAGECMHNIFNDRDARMALIKDFADALGKKLDRKALEGKSGWDDPEWPRDDIIAQLRVHIDKGDMLDVAAFAMFAWNRQ